MNIFSEFLNGLSGFSEMKQAIDSGISPLSVTGVSGIHKSHFVSACGKISLVIAEDEAAAKRLCDDINALSDDQCAVLYPAKDFTFTNVEGVSREYEQARLSVLTSLCGLTSHPCRIVLASAEAAMQKTLPPDELKRHTVILEPDMDIPVPELTEKLIAAG